MTHCGSSGLGVSMKKRSELHFRLLASTCNSTVIEMYGDKIRVSHGFKYCQSLGFIAELQFSLSSMINGYNGFQNCKVS